MLPLSLLPVTCRGLNLVHIILFRSVESSSHRHIWMRIQRHVKSITRATSLLTHSMKREKTNLSEKVFRDETIAGGRAANITFGVAFYFSLNRTLQSCPNYVFKFCAGRIKFKKWALHKTLSTVVI